MAVAEAVPVNGRQVTRTVTRHLSSVGGTGAGHYTVAPIPSTVVPPTLEEPPVMVEEDGTVIAVLVDGDRLPARPVPDLPPLQMVRIVKLRDDRVWLPLSIIAGGLLLLGILSCAAGHL